jgi:succinate dehydrogenase / fumarate reductase flavoprotein subunit
VHIVLGNAVNELEGVGLDPYIEPVPLASEALFFIGGLPVDEYYRVLDLEGSWVKGLFSAGEASGSGIHGADLLPGNAISEELLSGRLSGLAAASYLAKRGPRNPLARLRFDVDRVTWIRVRESGVEVSELIGAVRGASSALGPIRALSELAKAIRGLRAVLERAIEKGVRDPGVGGAEALKLIYQAFGLGLNTLAIAYSAYSRQCSRGAHRSLDCQYREGPYHLIILVRRDLKPLVVRRRIKLAIWRDPYWGPKLLI